MLLFFYFLPWQQISGINSYFRLFLRSKIQVSTREQQMAKQRRWTFTLHDSEIAWKPTLNVQTGCKYFICQLERAPNTGQIHWQGFLICHAPQRMAAIKKMLGSQQVHLEVARGTSKQNYDYCTKEESRHVYGGINK